MVYVEWGQRWPFQNKQSEVRYLDRGVQLALVIDVAINCRVRDDDYKKLLLKVESPALRLILSIFLFTFVLNINHKWFLVHGLSSTNHLINCVACIIGHICHVDPQNRSWIISKRLIFMAFKNLQSFKKKIVTKPNTVL